MRGADAALVPPDLREKGLAASAVALNPRVAHTTVGGRLVDPPSRRCRTSVGSDAWLRLLGTGGIEDDAEALR